MGEVDFFIDDVENMSVMPIEEKSGKDYYVHSALANIMAVDDYGIRQAVVLSNEREIRVKNNILYLPIYSVMFFKKQRHSCLILH